MVVLSYRIPFSTRLLVVRRRLVWRGANRYETAFTIAKYGKVQKSGSVVYLASGTGLKDAMVAGAAKDGVILLSPSNGEGVKAKAELVKFFV
ncbi:Putative cell wall binding repeat 2 [Mobiluncus mulieris]|nr:cell wall-binding repeat-containing protein [Mobiluncus mulieris]STY83209.1 Putative cell wall binding repeat 2 [Mobiluncus mulieris]